MPYFIWNELPDCSGWAVVKTNGELVGCHKDKQSAIEHMVGISAGEGIEPGGTYDPNGPQVEQSELRDVCEDCDGDCKVCGQEKRAAVEDLEVGQYVQWISDNDVITGEIYAINGTRLEVKVYDEEDGVWMETDLIALVEAERVQVIENLPTNEPEDEMDDEIRQVNLTPPAYMRAAARQGLRYYEEGKGGDGLVAKTIREARAMAAGSVTADKWVRMRAWIARHLGDLDSPAANPNSPDYPSAGVVAHLLWGSGPSKRAAQRALAYAEGVVARIEAENEGRAKGEALSKIETRVFTNEFEIREDGEGMTLTGYAAKFNEPSEPLPFIERIAPGAFKRSLKSRNDIKLLWNHDSSKVLGSTRAGTLKLEEDSIGLRVMATLPDNSWGRDAKVSIARGDVTGFSFGFTVPAGGDSWNSDGSERTLKSVRLLEVSTGVAFPAYPSTNGTAQVRALDAVAERAGVDADQLADALLKLEEGVTITQDEKDILSRVISDLAPSEAKEEKPDLGILALKKKKLELLTKGII